MKNGYRNTPFYSRMITSKTQRFWEHEHEYALKVVFEDWQPESYFCMVKEAKS